MHWILQQISNFLFKNYYVVTIWIKLQNIYILPMNFTFEGVSKKLKAPFWNPFELDKKTYNGCCLHCKIQVGM